MRRLRLLPVLLVLGLAASACSTFNDPPAVTVDGREVSTDVIDNEMKTILGNQAYSGGLERVYGFQPKAAEVAGAFDTAFAAQVISLRVWFDVWERDLAARGERDLITDAEETVAADIPDQVDSALGAGAFDAFPASFQKDLVHQQAIVQAIRQSVSDEIKDPETYYEAHPEDFAEICVSHILVSVQGGRSEAEARERAAAIRARIEDGEDFEEIAANESDDPGSAAERGALGCGTRASLQFVPEFEAAAFALKVGEVSEPVQSQFGSHLILVTKRTVPDFDEIEDVDTEMQGIADQLLNDRFTSTLCKADVDVNPKYGRWSRDVCDDTVQSTLPRVEPPEGPRVDEDETSTPSGP